MAKGVLRGELAVAKEVGETAKLQNWPKPWPGWTVGLSRVGDKRVASCTI